MSTTRRREPWQRRRSRRPALRVCLRCNGLFRSEGSWNRLCEPCNEANSRLTRRELETTGRV